MIFNRASFIGCFIAVATVFGGFDALAVQAPNPRGGSTTQSSARSTDSSRVVRVTTPRSVVRSNNTSMIGRGAVYSNAMRGGATGARGSQSGMLVRSATNRGTGSATTARTATVPNASRASVARATAVFNDISKIGGGYAACRESYATCMDQFCANANDTYRRCYCSSRFAEFRDTENALDQAKTLLMQFEDNNLNAVDKTAAEVNAMYSATVGEQAIKNDTSAAAKMLDEIGDLLSGKKKTYSTNNSSTSLGVLTLDLSGDIDDIWSDGGSSIFSSNGGQNLSELEGVNLYNAANKQCINLIKDSCESNAVFNMARSSYSILITQDCNAYQKNIDKKVEAVKQTVRTAEKYLREARLDEYRSHNSADVNECITKVRSAITADTACGANYKRCLDYTGAYVNQTTGEAIYSPRLFQLTNLIKLSGTDGGMDVLAQNDEFNNFLESRKIFANAALDTCRDISSVVWDEFKRTALIEIAQAQDEKIEEVKMSCVSTMADCYDTQSSALKDFDNTTAQMAGALSAYAAKKMCVDKVSACAALYGNGESCDFDDDGRLKANSSACGLTALLNFVNAVDDIRIAEGCETAMKNYAKELCTPTSGTQGYPWNCRLMDISQVKANIADMAKTYCSEDVVGGSGDPYKSSDTIINDLITDIQSDMVNTLAEMCEEREGIWIDFDKKDAKDEYLATFYRNVYGTTQPPRYKYNNQEKDVTSYGVCIKNSIKSMCDIADVQSGGLGYAKYDPLTDKCKFTVDYYKYQCDIINGTWEENRCLVDNKE